MPNALELCRICMSVNIKMFTLIDTNMENLYHLLTQVYVDTEDKKPKSVCFLCYARLRQCDRLQQQAIKSNELLEQLLKGGFMQPTANAILKGQYSSQDLQVSSTYYLDLQPANCADVLLDLKVEANDQISVKEEVEAIDEGYNVTTNAILSGQYSSQDLQVPSTYYLELEPMNCEDDLLDPKVEANDLISVKEEEAIDEGCNVTENMCTIQQEKGIRNYTHPSNLIQILKTGKSSHNNEINMKSGRNVGKKKSTLITNKHTFQRPLKNNEDAAAYKESEKIWEETEINVVSKEQKIQKSIYDKDTQEENMNNPQTSVIKTIIDEYQCNACGKQFSTKVILTNHILKCMKTTETSLSDSQLTKTDTVKSLLSEKPFSCNICEYRSARKHYLQVHMRTHTGEKPYSCNICEYRCSLKRNLKHHMGTHTGEKPFSCNICEYRCAQKSYLIRHIRTHTGEKPFSCNICVFKCSQRHHLKVHMRKHTGEKPFSCNICEFRSSHNGDLIKHIRKHTGEKPFSCNICEYRSTRKDRLKNHLRTHD